MGKMGNFNKATFKLDNFWSLAPEDEKRGFVMIDVYEFSKRGAPKKIDRTTVPKEDFHEPKVKLMFEKMFGKRDLHLRHMYLAGKRMTYEKCDFMVDRNTNNSESEGEYNLLSFLRGGDPIAILKTINGIQNEKEQNDRTLKKDILKIQADLEKIKNNNILIEARAEKLRSEIRINQDKAKLEIEERRIDIDRKRSDIGTGEMVRNMVNSALTNKDDPLNKLIVSVAGYLTYKAKQKPKEEK